MDSAEVRQRILDSYGLRIEPEMSQYIARRLEQASDEPLTVLGADARTGIPIRAEIDPRVLGVGGEKS